MSKADNRIDAETPTAAFGLSFGCLAFGVLLILYVFIGGSPDGIDESGVEVLTGRDAFRAGPQDGAAISGGTRCGDRVVEVSDSRNEATVNALQSFKNVLVGGPFRQPNPVELARHVDEHLLGG